MGILEDIVARLAAVEAKLANGNVGQPVAAVAQPVAQPAAVAQPAFDPMTGQPLTPAQPAAQPAPQPVITGYDPTTGQPIYGTVQAATPAPAATGAITEAQVMALIEPHLENVPVKTALQGVLAQMGIARLPDARPDQYADLYNRFNAVIQQFVGAVPAVQPAAVGGII